jgi:hypothetical protein
MGMKAIRGVVRTTLQRTSIGYRFLLQRDYGVRGPSGRPDAAWASAVLRSSDEVKRSVEQVQRLGLPLIGDHPKNWDSLAALDLILRSTDRTARVFDAGGALYSMDLRCQDKVVHWKPYDLAYTFVVFSLRKAR